MARALGGIAIDLLDQGDIVAAAQCIAIDADVFPYKSVRFGRRTASDVVWVARDEEPLEPSRWPPVVAFLAVETREDRSEIHGLAVEPAYRRRGIARALLRVVFTVSQESGLSRVVLRVWEKNAPAVALYESEGFQIRRKLRDFYPAWAFGAHRDAYEMVRRV
jgi:ribosomal protein S18 acetylase RimI-like enzyme